MKTVCLLLVLSVLALANPISVGPIILTGSGSYEWGYGVGPVLNFSAFGSNGTDSASLYVSDGEDRIYAYVPLPFTGGLAPLGPFFEGTGTIDGITVSNFPVGPPFTRVDYSLSGDEWFLSLYDMNGLIAHAGLMGQIDVTGYTENRTASGMLVYARTDFDIAPMQTPEVGTLGSTLIGLCAWVIHAQLRLKPPPKVRL